MGTNLSRITVWTEYFTGLEPSENRSRGNRTIDVLRKNCFTDFDTVACARSTILCFLSAITAVLCVSRLVRLHYIRTNQQLHHHLAIFYVAVVHCLTGSAEWFIGWTTQGSLACLYLRSVELVIICHFYLTLVSRVLRCEEEPAARKIVLCLSMLFVYFTTFVVIGLVYAQTPWLDCFAPYWLFISGGQLLTIQLLVVTSVMLCKKINAVSAQESMKRAQRRDLLCLILGFEISAIVTIVYHTCMFFMANDDIGCSGVFHHKQWAYSGVKIPYEIVTYLLPIWVVIWIFRPTTQMENEWQAYNTLISSMSDDFISGPYLVPSPTVRNWRRAYRPLSAPNLLLEQGQTPPGRILHRPHGRSRWGRPRSRNGMRRCLSAPSLRSGRRQGSQVIIAAGPTGSNLIATSAGPFSPRSLAPIPEESGSRGSSQGSSLERSCSVIEYVGSLNV